MNSGALSGYRMRLTRGGRSDTLQATTTSRLNVAEHRYVGPLLHDRIIGALELCCRRGEMLLIQNKRVNWESCQIGIPGATTNDKENRRVPFNPDGRIAAILRRRSTLGPDAYVFGTETGRASRTSRRPGRRFDSSPMESSRNPGERGPSGTANSSNGSTSAGMIFGTKGPVDSWPTASTSASSS